MSDPTRHEAVDVQSVLRLRVETPVQPEWWPRAPCICFAWSYSSYIFSHICEYVRLFSKAPSLRRTMTFFSHWFTLQERRNGVFNSERDHILTLLKTDKLRYSSQNSSSEYKRLFSKQKHLRNMKFRAKSTLLKITLSICHLLILNSIMFFFQSSH